jgi:hypothetical protein
VNRAWYRCAACGHGLAPRDAELGLAGDTMSRGLAKMTARAAAAEPFATGSGLLADLAGIQVGARRIERHAEADGAAAAAVITAQAAAITAGKVVPLPPADLPDMMYIAVDGTGVPMMTAETEGRDGKGEDGRSRTREVKLACVFTQTRVDEDGNPVRDPGSSSYSASSPSSVTARTGSGTWPLSISPRPPRSWTSSTPASTCTSSARCSLL